ncbi:hypothetical protein NE865_03676 [Phthorimaea operculella]|nr:hypothetical protein NE865_03676 [Phthorimaea operculella]
MALIAAVSETKEDDIREALKTQTEHQLALVPRGPKVVRDTVAYNTTINTDDTTEHQLALVPRGPKVVRDTVAYNTTINTDDTEELRALGPDGTIVTERRHTKEQERVCDEELEDKEEVRSLASDQSLVRETGGTERRKRVEQERSTDLMAGGLRVATHLHSRTHTEQGKS